jgi:hypothetical protein
MWLFARGLDDLVASTLLPLIIALAPATPFALTCYSLVSWYPVYLILYMLEERELTPGL